ncbi:MAG: carboxypeptidase regulatory-like domain-containing protein, partial [Chloroflexi bacterium]
MSRLYVPLAAGLLLIIVAGAVAVAGTPTQSSSFYGVVTLDGASVPAGTLISAWMDGVKLAEAPTTRVGGYAIYLISVPGDDPDTPQVEGGREDRPIHFRVAGYEAVELAPWRAGTRTRLDLTSATAWSDRISRLQSSIAQNVVISGVVQDCLTGAGIPGERVRVLESPAFAALTAPDGSYQIEAALPLPAEYTVEIRHPGFF